MWLRQLPGSGSLCLTSAVNCFQTSSFSGPLFSLIRGCYQSSANRGDRVQVLQTTQPCWAGCSSSFARGG